MVAVATDRSVAAAVDATKHLQGRTGGDGTHRLHLDFDGVRPAQPYTVSAQAVIQDINRQTLAANASLIVHPSAVYVGLKSDDLFVEQGKKLTVDALVCDIDGKVDAGRTISIPGITKGMGLQEGQVEPERRRREGRGRNAPAASAITTDFTPAKGGQWTVKATVHDDRERPNESELTLWVSGGDNAGPKDKQRGSDGRNGHADSEPQRSTARARRQPFSSSRRSRTRKAWRASFMMASSPFTHFTVKGSTYTLHVPIADAFLPGVGLQVELVGSAPRTDDAGKANPRRSAAPRVCERASGPHRSRRPHAN